MFADNGLSSAGVGYAVRTTLVFADGSEKTYDYVVPNNASGAADTDNFYTVTELTGWDNAIHAVSYTHLEQTMKALHQAPPASIVQAFQADCKGGIDHETRL